MTRPLLLDLFCGAGGAAMGYHRAGFDVVGVDVVDQPHYPFAFIRADAMAIDWRGFDAVHASPPCQDHSVTNYVHGIDHGTGGLLADTVDRLGALGVPWVVENVAGPTVRMAGWWVTLCGTAFGLNLRRHRRFGSSMLMLAPPCRHADYPLALSVAGHDEQGHTFRKWVDLTGFTPEHADRCEAMGIGWMDRRELPQAIPPAFTEWIGGHLLRCLVTS